MTFKDLEIGDTYNTKAYRATKINDTDAIVIMSGIHELYDILNVNPDTSVIPISTYKHSSALTTLLHKNVVDFNGKDWIYQGDIL